MFESMRRVSQSCLGEGTQRDPVVSGEDQADPGEIYRIDWGSGPECLGLLPLRICRILGRGEALTTLSEMGSVVPESTTLSSVSKACILLTGS